MRVYKNLFGNGSKINASEIVTKNPANEVTALDLLGVEIGNNANGWWRRTNDGYMRCWKNDATIDLSDVAPWRWVDYIWTFPKPFWGYTAVVSAIARGSGGLNGNVNVTFVGAGTATKNNNITIRVCLMDATSTQTECALNLRAEGLWKTPGT